MLSYKTALWPAMKYPLGVSQLTEKEVKEIVSPLMPVLKHACYLGEKFSDAIMKLPLRYGGYGVNDVSAVMTIEQAKMLLSAYRMKGNTGVKLMALLEFSWKAEGQRRF